LSRRAGHCGRNFQIGIVVLRELEADVLEGFPEVVELWEVDMAGTA
jgi:hypothetical protein